MSLFKCKMCGGDLEIAEGVTIAECEYCGTKQTVPKAMDENLQNLFNRATTLRIKSEFDKAEKMYEKIIQADTTQAEAYWGLILCKYGIEYVDDPATYKKIPTCHRASYDSIIADDDYKSALEYADMSQRALYEEQAREIDRIQKDILALAQKEETYDVFICYKETDSSGKRTPDSVIANDIYYQLKQEGFKVFYAAITLEGKLGSAYEPIIFAALNSAKVMLVVGTKPEYFNAVWVKNEWSRFLKIIQKDRSKLLIPCYRDMDAYELPEEFAHLQAQNMSKIGFMQDLIRGIKKVVLKSDAPNTVTREFVDKEAYAQAAIEALERKKAEENAANAKKKKKRAAIIGAVVGVLIAVMVAGVLCYPTKIAPMMQYNQALELLNSGDYANAYSLFESLGDYRDSAEHMANFVVCYDKITITVSNGYQETKINTYDSNGYLIKETVTDINGYINITDSVFDEKGNRIKGTLTTTDPDKTGGVSEYYDFDSNGNFARHINTFSDGSIVEIFHFYDEYSNEIKESWVDSDGSKNEFNYQLTYDSNGNVIKKVSCDSSGILETEDYTYNEKGDLVQSVVTQGTDTWEYTYDEFGYALSVIARSSGTIVGTGRYEYEGQRIFYMP